MKTAAYFAMAASMLLASVQAVRLKREQLGLLRELLAALELMEGELVLRNSPLPELLSELSETLNGDAKRMICTCLDKLSGLQDENFSVIWKNAAEECCSSLGERELSAFVRLGTSLGRYDLETQLRDIRNTQHLLRKSLEEAERSFPAQRKLWLGLGASAAALLGVILV